ncbi:MAG: class I SAM-dependent methyltransferase [Rubrobacter sp.]|nr:class I SAM-dependent methyltransferase [Rubrobacter sp.]
MLDAGAGTGFLSLAARLGYQVSALDLSSEMLQRLRAKVAAESLEVEVIEGPADHVPTGEFDAVVERHLVWTLPDPAATLMTWRSAASTDRLILFESAWGSAAEPHEALKAWARTKLRRLRRIPPPHHFCSQ